MWAAKDPSWMEMSRILSRLQYGDFVRAMRRTIEVGKRGLELFLLYPSPSLSLSLYIYIYL